MRKLLAVLTLVIISTYSYADIEEIDATPSTWKLENYLGSSVVAWFTASTCNNGVIQFPANATIEDKNRFWSVVMAAKLSDKKIFVRYDNATSQCFITSFGIWTE